MKYPLLDERFIPTIPLFREEIGCRAFLLGLAVPPVSRVPDYDVHPPPTHGILSNAPCSGTCRFPASTPMVSGTHTEFIVEEDGSTLAVDKSSNGTFISGSDKPPKDLKALGRDKRHKLSAGEYLVLSRYNHGHTEASDGAAQQQGVDGGFQAPRRRCGAKEGDWKRRAPAVSAAACPSSNLE